MAEPRKSGMRTNAVSVSRASSPPTGGNEYHRLLDSQMQFVPACGFVAGKGDTTMFAGGGLA
jgi:hypothetical protein